MLTRVPESRARQRSDRQGGIGNDFRTEQETKNEMKQEQLKGELKSELLIVLLLESAHFSLLDSSKERLPACLL